MTWTDEFNETHARELIAEHYPTLTQLQSDVVSWLLDHAADYDGPLSVDNIAGVLSDLAYGGCASGIVGHLIYNSDVTAYFAQHGAECARVVSDIAADCGCDIGELLRQWDQSDPLALEINNKTMLAWAAFEQTAHDIGLALGLDI